MKILLINHYAGSVYHGMEFRPYYFAREWVKMGHEVVIVAASYSHLRQKNIAMKAPMQEELIDGIKYVWLKTPEYSGNGIGRVKNMAVFIYKLYKYLPQITSDFKPEAVIASSTYPLDSYPANWIAKKYGAKFVFELHDLWPMSPMVLGHMPKYHPFIWIMQRGEDYWCRNADIVVSLLPEAYKHLVTRGMTMDKYKVLQNGIVLEEWQHKEPLSEAHQSIVNKLKRDGKYLIAQTGGLVVGNNLDNIIEMGCILNDKKDISLLIIGKGPEEIKTKKMIEEHHLENVVLLPPVPKKQVPSLLSEMDILIRSSKPSVLDEYGMSPNKIFDYMMAAKPILLFSQTEENLVDQAHCGFALKSYRSQEMAEKILEIQQMPAKEVLSMGLNGKEYVLKNYRYEILAQNFITMLENKKD